MSRTVTRRFLLPAMSILPGVVAGGSHDKTIPPHHQQAAARELPHADLLEITGAGHYPHETAPDRLLPPLQAFLTSTPPFNYSETRWRELLHGPQAQAA